MVSQPFLHSLGGPGRGENVWGEPDDKTFVHRGDKKLGKHIASSLLEQGFPMTYSLTNSHHADDHGPTTLTHAFLNALLYLDWDRKGFDYPVVPIQVNAYGKNVIQSRGFISHLDPNRKNEPFGDDFAPPSASPAGCVDLGRRIRGILGRSPRQVRGHGFFGLVSRLPGGQALLALAGHRGGPETPRPTARRRIQQVGRANQRPGRRFRSARVQELDLHVGGHGRLQGRDL